MSVLQKILKSENGRTAFYRSDQLCSFITANSGKKRDIKRSR